MLLNLKSGLFSAMGPKDAEETENSEDPDQTAPWRADLDLHCLPRYICPKT